VCRDLGPIPVEGTRRPGSKSSSSSMREADDGSCLDRRWLADAGLVVGTDRVVVAGSTVASVGVSSAAGAGSQRDGRDPVGAADRDAVECVEGDGICSSSSAHRRFQEWEQAGVFAEIWRRGLLDYDEVVGIDWSWLAADGAMTKAPLGGAKTGPNPTDRAKKGRNVRFSARRQGSRSGWHTTAPTGMTQSS
jgi:hypothetical protein